jgi:hypothetical protein
MDSATVPTQITYDGVADYSENTLDVATFAAMSQGSIIGIADEARGTLRCLFSIGDTSVNTDFATIFQNDDETIKFRIWQSGANIIVLDSVDPVVEGDVCEFKSDGVIVKFFKNGIESAITGTNGTYWFNDVLNPDSMYISRLTRSTNAFYTTNFKHLMIRSTPLTDTESLQYANYLISKHNL